jgi:hypothetical protein
MELSGGWKKGNLVGVAVIRAAGWKCENNCGVPWRRRYGRFV